MNNVPHDQTAEEAVICSMLMDSTAIDIAQGILNPDDFYHNIYGVYFKAMVEIHGEGKPADVVTLQDRLNKMDIADEYKSLDYIRQILDLEITSANIRHYAQIVHSKSLSRQFIKYFTNAINQSYTGDIKNIIASAEEEIIKYTSSKDDDVVHISQVIDEAVKQTKEASEKKYVGIPTGYVDLDRMTGGLLDREFTVISARPAMGKTALILNMINHIAVKQGLPIAIFSLEMDRLQLAKRLLSIRSSVDAQKIKSGKMEESEWDDFTKASEELKKANIYIDDISNNTVAQVRSKSRRLKMQHGIRAIFIDYIQILESGAKVESRRIEMDKISRSIRQVARELEIPVVAVAQLSRGVDARNEKRPMMSDLRESGQIEQDANNILFLYRDFVYNKDASENDAELIIAKSRDGKTGTVKLQWLPEQLKFVSVEVKEEIPFE